VPIFQNEREEIDRILKNGFTDGTSNVKELQLIAKYCIWDLNYNDSKTEAELHRFCSIWDKNYNRVLDRKRIKYALRNAKKRPINQEKTIIIYQNELKSIEILKNFRYQKLAFVMLALAKFNRGDGYSDYNVWFDQNNRVISLSELKLNSKEFKNIRSGFRQMGLMIPIEVGGKNKTNGFDSLLFVDESSASAIKIINFDESLINKYLEYYGGEMIVCKNCENLFPKSSNHQTYCNSCLEIREKESVRKRVAKHRNLM
jgi:hypothetical protein